MGSSLMVRQGRAASSLAAVMPHRVSTCGREARSTYNVVCHMQTKRRWPLSCTSMMSSPRPLHWTWCASWRRAAPGTRFWQAGC